MRTQTPSFIVKVKLHLQNNVKNHLNKSFHIADSAYNETLNHGLKLFSAMKKKSKISRTTRNKTRCRER